MLPCYPASARLPQLLAPSGSAVPGLPSQGSPVLRSCRNSATPTGDGHRSLLASLSGCWAAQATADFYRGGEKCVVFAVKGVV